MGAVLKIGDRVRGVIGDVAFGGDGVARVSGLAIFVPFTVDGDEVEIEITETRKRYARGRLVRVVTPSVHRVQPPCPYYTRCGGCRMQHIGYGHQLELKRRQVAEAFRRIAGMAEAPVQPVIPSPRPFGWRGKAEFHLAGGPDGSRRVGLMAKASREIIEIERCAIVEESINRKYRELRDALRSGLLRAESERQTIWSDEPGEPPTEVFTGGGRPPDITRIVHGRRLTVPGRGFFQANVALVGGLVDRVIEMGGLAGTERVIDGYAGAGLFSLFLGANASALWGIEGEPEAVRCAGINLAREGLSQARAIRGDVADALGEFVRSGRKADLVLVDPPRDGCGEEVVDRLAALLPERVIYISCNPATQARDLRRLAGHGYRLVLLQPLDMFPQTAHIEVIASLTRGKVDRV